MKIVVDKVIALGSGGSFLAPYFNDCMMILAASLADPFPSLKICACEVVVAISVVGFHIRGWFLYDRLTPV